MKWEYPEAKRQQPISKHIDGKTLLQAMDMIKRGEKIQLIMERTGMGRAQVNELIKRARQ